MKRFTLTALCVIMALSFTGCGKKTDTTVKSTDSSAINVKVEKVTETSIADSVTYSGEVKATESASVSAKASGTARSVLKDIGDYVTKGETLATIDDTDYRTQLNLAQVAYNQAKTNYENQKYLYENGAISKVAFDSAEAAFENASLNLQMARNALNNTIVTAPISGYIAGRNTNPGQLISPGVEIFSIKSAEVEVQVNVTESVISNIAVGSKATVSVKAAGLEDVEATVKNVGVTKDAYTGMYKVIIGIEENSVIKDGMFAEVEITLNESTEAIVISSNALLDADDGTKYVYVADGENARRVDVVTGIVTDEKVEIISGISVGDEVIVSGKEYISEKNTAIKIVD